VFASWWHIVQKSGIPLSDEFKSIIDVPYTFTHLIRKRMQIDSWMELPKDKRPPKEIWDKPNELEEWFNRVFDSEKQTEFNVPIDENEVER